MISFLSKPGRYSIRVIYVLNSLRQVTKASQVIHGRTITTKYEIIMKKWMIFFIAGFLMALYSCTKERSEVNDSQWDHSINFGWKFEKGDLGEAIDAGFDDSKWESVDLPHDWAISGPFGPLKSYGGTGKLPWWGEGWYRKSFELPAETAGQRLQFLFDGVMANPTVYLNGQKVGSWRYGYNSFWIDATEAAVYGGTNVLTVHTDTREHGSRWYPGAGIYRKIGMRLVDPLHIPVWGVYVTTPEVSGKLATVRAKIEVNNSSGSSRETLLEIGIKDPSGNTVKTVERKLTLEAGKELEEEFELKITLLYI
jgi:beta-galactosidase